jgi:hypothetical protein
LVIRVVGHIPKLLVFNHFLFLDLIKLFGAFGYTLWGIFQGEHTGVLHWGEDEGRGSSTKDELQIFRSCVCGYEQEYWRKIKKGAAVQDYSVFFI